MLRWVLLALLGIPLADALLLVVLAAYVDPVVIVALVVLTALVGTMLARAAGRQTLRRIQLKLARGEAPTDELADAGLLLAAGAFLLSPGFVTDAAGLLLVFPPTRAVVRTLLKRYVLIPRLDERTGGFATGNVYTFGFPNGGAAGSTASNHVDVDEDSYDVTVGEPDEDDDENRAT